jgi:predicted lipoprotein with Yx(FWY)xxD motif
MRFGGTPLLTAGISLLALGLLAPGSRAEEYGPLKKEKTQAGEVLADAQGMVVYTYDKDKPGEATCTGKCADFWPPVKAAAGEKPAGKLTVVKRPDGTMQWAYGGKPLYLYKDDKKAGDANGDGKGGAWHVVKAE